MFSLSVIAGPHLVCAIAGDSFSGATHSVITGTGGRHAVPDTSFRQTISAVEFFPTCVPVMYELSRATNIFLVPVTQDNPLRLTYEQDVLRRSNEEFDDLRHRGASVVTPLPFSVLEHFKRHLKYFGSGGVAVFTVCGLMVMRYRCGTSLVSVVTQLSLRALNTGIIGGAGAGGLHCFEMWLC